MPSEPTRYQYSSRLAFNQKTPTFIQRLKNQVAGLPSNHRDDDDEPAVDFEDEFSAWQEGGGSGRPPIPTRPRNDGPDDDKEEYYTDEFGRERRRERRPDVRGGEDDRDLEEEQEDDEEGEERPVVVVLKEGKHLSAWEVENEKRKAKGLPPLPDPSKAPLPSSSSTNPTTSKSSTSSTKQSLSFSSTPSSLTTAQKGRLKRKLLGDAGRDDSEDLDDGQGWEGLKRRSASGVKEKAKMDEGKSVSKESGATQGPKKKSKKEKKTLLSFGDEG